MNAQVQALQSPAPASNGPHAPGQNAAPPRLLPRRASGWDPYEVWRTRIKPPRDPAPAAWEPRK
jgi:hypothetical protein